MADQRRKHLADFAAAATAAAAAFGAVVVEADKRRRAPKGLGRRFVLRYGAALVPLVVVPRPDCPAVTDIHVGRVPLDLSAPAAAALGLTPQQARVEPSADWRGTLAARWQEAPRLADWIVRTVAMATFGHSPGASPLQIVGNLAAAPFEAHTFAAWVAVLRRRGVQFSRNGNLIRVEYSDTFAPLLAAEVAILRRSAEAIGRALAGEPDPGPAFEVVVMPPKIPLGRVAAL